MKQPLFPVVLVTFLVIFIFGTEEESSTQTKVPINKDISNYEIYSEVFKEHQISFQAFSEAYEKKKLIEKEQNIRKDSLLTIIDYSKNCNDERLFVIDLNNKKLLKNSLVAHGQNSGVYIASKFSNTPRSHMSSLGAFFTSNTYQGKHGYSLRLDGIEKGVNDNARKRAIVIHGAHYVSDDYIKKTGRIGRSFGCPALPYSNYMEIINLIKEESFLYIYHPAASDSTLAMMP